MSKVDELLGMQPFSERKEGLFNEAMRESLAHHYANCELYRRFCQKNGFDPAGDYAIEDVPFFPVSLFKTLKLVSVDEKDIVKSVASSATTSGVPSKVYLDSITARRQVRALSAIMSSFIGQERKAFIVFDSPETVKSSDGRLSSRATAIRGMLPFSKSMAFVLDSNLELDGEALARAVGSARSESVCFLGFTFIIHRIMEGHSRDSAMKRLLQGVKDSRVLHLGGWKKLQELNVPKAEFNRNLAQFLSTREGRIIDIYGMTEQLGTIYPDCEFGFKHVPAYSDIIIRDTRTLEPAEDGRPGFIQLLTPLPHSYPGVSVISDDIGVVVKDDGCECGRRGKAFLFRSRAEKAELKGCGDTLAGEDGG